jgi:protocatechuate 3,4-dioxygenase, alpha subunit
MTKLQLTASQTVGPFFKYGLSWEAGGRVFPAGTAGRAITLTGKVLDGEGQPLPDAVVEVWQADADGQFATRGANGTCPGFGRVGTSPTSGFTFETIMPGRVRDAAGVQQAPHLQVTVFARGLLMHLYTRVYFEGEPGFTEDPVVRAAGDRASTLLAKKIGPASYEWNIVLQGAGETVFFAL